jgi:very-short-patch-repair endonuclease
MHVSGAIVILGVLVAVGVATVWAKLRKRDYDALSKRWPLVAKRHVLTERERTLYGRLVQSLPNHIVLSQVQLSQVLIIQHGQPKYAIFNRISRLSLDFLILNPDASVVAAIELDDVTHAHENRRKADARKSHALQSAGVPLIRWNADKLPDVEAIRAAVAAPKPKERK